MMPIVGGGNHVGRIILLQGRDESVSEKKDNTSGFVDMECSRVIGVLVRKCLDTGTSK